MADTPKVSDLIGRTLTAVEKVDDEAIRFTTDAGEVFKLYHSQDCCESVTVEDITGDLANLVGAPILMADEVSSTEWPADREQTGGSDSFTWTFYKFGTMKGYVDIRFLGTSNGYYSESVNFVRES